MISQSKLSLTLLTKQIEAQKGKCAHSGKFMSEPKLVKSGIKYFVIDAFNFEVFKKKHKNLVFA